MKQKFSNSAINFLCTILLLVSSGMVSLQAKAPNGTTGSKLEATIVDDSDAIVGRWLYTVADVAYEYSHGALYISEDNGVYQVEVHVNNGTLRGQDIEVAQNKITFSLEIEGSNVVVTLRAKEDKLSGESSSADGIFKIKGKRKAQPQ